MRLASKSSLSRSRALSRSRSPSIPMSLALSLAAACGGVRHAAPAAGPAPAPAPAPVPADNAALVARGGQLYGAHCASCHGDAGQGTAKGPPVVGVAAGALPLAPRPGARRDVPFHTAADVGGWAAAHMPADDPGSLPLADYVAILAFDLHANGVELGAEPFTLERAQAIVLHP